MTKKTRMMKKAFTLIELLVAIGIFAMVLSFATVIFQASVDSYRTATANANIMQKLRAITDQLNADFKGVVQTYPGRMDIETVGSVNADRIAFLANGDFQSTGQYGGKTAIGNIASIFYGQAADAYPNVDPNTDPFMGEPKEKILARIQTILTSDSDPCLSNSGPRDEYYKRSLAEWVVNPPLADVDWTVRPRLDTFLEEDLVMYMAKGVHNFTIEQFDGIDSTEGIKWLRRTDNISTKALKFTFTLYDSRGVIKQGRTFTYIVYLGD